MATSTRLKWPYPSEGVDPWYEAFQSFVEAADTTSSALLEAKNILLSGGGFVSWDAATGVLSWTQPIVFNSSNSGFLESIPAGSITVPQDNQLGFVRFVAFPTNGVTLTLEVADSLPGNDIDRTLVLFRRKGTTLYFRNGGVVRTGETLTIFEGIASVAGVSATLPLASSGGTSPVISLVQPVPLALGGTGRTFVGATAGQLLYYDGSPTQIGLLPQFGLNRIILGNSTGGLKDIGSAGIAGQALVLNPSLVPEWTTLAVGVDASASTKGVLKLLGGLSGLGSTADLPILNVGSGNVTGILSPANGGTGNNATPTAAGVAVGDGTKITYTAPGTSFQVFVIDSGTGLPKWGTVNLASASAVTGLLPVGNQAAQTLGGDLSGTTGAGAASVIALRGVPISATAPTPGQYLGYTGGNWTPVTAATSGGGFGNGGIVYYLNYTTPGQVPCPANTSEMDAQFDELAASNLPVPVGTSPTDLWGFITPLNDPSVSIITPGTWEFSVYADASAAGCFLIFELYYWDTSAGAAVLIGTSSDVPITTIGSTVQYTGSIYSPATNVDLDDRIYMKVRGKCSAGTETITLYFEGNTTVSHVHSTINAPGGTGVLKVFNGYLLSPASLIIDADIDPAANISPHKLSPVNTPPVVPITATKVLGSDGTNPPEWVDAPATGVTSLTAGTGLSGGTITSTGTISVNYGTSAGTALEGTNATRLLPNSPSPTQGTIAYHNGTSWQLLLGPTSGTNLVLTVASPGTNPVWSALPTSTPTIAPVTSAYTVQASDSILYTSGSSSFTITMLTAVGNSGKTITLKHAGTGTITVIPATATSQTFDGASSITISAQYTSFTFVSDGSNWLLV